MSSDKPAKWGGRQGRGDGTKPGPATTKPLTPRPRVSVAQPQRRIDAGRPFSSPDRAAAERDASLGRKIAAAVLAVTILVFGSNYAGLWESPGQREARLQAERKRPGPAKEAADKQRIAMERREADRRRSEQLARERAAQRKAADEEAARRAREEASKHKAEEAGRPPPAPERPNLAETDCQTTRPVSVIVPACSAILAQHGDYAEAYAVRGWALRERNQPERALTDFNRALQLQPNNAATHSQRALTYLRLRDFDRALEDYNKAIELSPQSASFYNDRGVAYMDLKDFTRAAADFDRAIEHDPRYPLAYNNRARATVLGSGDHGRAIADLDRAIELNPKYALAFENRGLSHLELKDLTKALADFSSAVELNPRSARALNARGVAYERQGNRDLAIADYRRALDADQNFSAARENLTRLGEKL
jgi:tetratricopeptide (TPR) repeat protein